MNAGVVSCALCHAAGALAVALDPGAVVCCEPTAADYQHPPDVAQWRTVRDPFTSRIIEAKS